MAGLPVRLSTGRAVLTQGIVVRRVSPDAGGLNRPSEDQVAVAGGIMLTREPIENNLGAPKDRAFLSTQLLSVTFSVITTATICHWHSS